MADTPRFENNPQQRRESDQGGKPHDGGGQPPVSERMKDIGSAATEKAQKLWESTSGAASEIQHRAGDAISSVGEQMKSLAGSLRERVPQEGMLGTAASAMAGTLESGADYLQQQNLSQMAEDVARVVRRYPFQSVLVGMGVGFLLAKTLRS